MCLCIWEGGVGILIYKRFTSSDPESPSFPEKELVRDVVPGRVVRVTLSDRTKLPKSDCVFVHSFGLNSSRVAEIELG